LNLYYSIQYILSNILAVESKKRLQTSKDASKAALGGLLCRAVSYQNF
jgi:hypothetical protein